MMTTTKKTPGLGGRLGRWQFGQLGFKEGFFEIVVFNLKCEVRKGLVLLRVGRQASVAGIKWHGGLKAGDRHLGLQGFVYYAKKFIF